MTANPSIAQPFIPHKGGAPSKLLLLTEGGRAAFGLGVYAATRKILKYAPKGDGHPVLVVPGFMTGDITTVILRSFLKDMGYAPKTWDMGINFGRPEYAERLLQRLEEIQAMYGGKVSIVGWSLGGVFAREVAKEKPELVRQVITLGSPFSGIQEENNARWLYDLLHGPKGMDMDSDLLRELHQTPPVPTTAIYSKEDGIVCWQHCMELDEDEQTQNVRVNGSHFGLGHNPAVLYCMADRLAQGSEDWKTFDPKGLVSILYPDFC